MCFLDGLDCNLTVLGPIILNQLNYLHLLVLEVLYLFHQILKLLGVHVALVRPLK